MHSAFRSHATVFSTVCSTGVAGGAALYYADREGIDLKRKASEILGSLCDLFGSSVIFGSDALSSSSESRLSSFFFGRSSSPPATCRATSSYHHVKYSIDPVRSKLGFRLYHMRWQEVTGNFGEFSGSVEMKFSDTDIEANCIADAEVVTASIDTQNWLRDWRMRNEFLEAGRFPSLKFRGKQQIPLEDRPFSAFRADGEVCIRGIWQPLVLTVHLRPNTGDEHELRAHVTGEIKRLDFGVLKNWPDFTVSNEIKLDFDIVAVAAEQENQRKQ